MTVKKKKFNENEITIFDEALIYKREEHWHFRMCVEDEKKYAGRSLKTKKETEAKELAKRLYFKIYSKIQQGDKFFSMSAKEGVDAYLKERHNDFFTGLIVKERYKS